MSLTKWSFLWSAALIFHYTGSSQSCKKMITITNMSIVGTINLTSACHCFYTHEYCQSSKSHPGLIGSHCLMYVSEQSPTGVCSINTSNTQLHFNVTNGSYEVILDRRLTDDIILRFLRNVSKFLPSQNVNNPDVCPNNKCCKVTLQDFCKNVPCWKTACTGNDDRYIIQVQDNDKMQCKSCQLSTCPQATQASDVGANSPPTSTSTISEAGHLMKNLIDQAKSICENCSLPVETKISKGLLLKNGKNASVSIGYDDKWDVQAVNDISQSKWSVTVPEEAFNMARMELNDTPFLVVVRFPGLMANITNNDYTLYFKSDVFGISMGVDITNLTNTIDIYFRHLNMTASDNWTCMSNSHTAEATWTTSGCETQFINNTTIQCSCTHLTFFAILMYLTINAAGVLRMVFSMDGPNEPDPFIIEAVLSLSIEKQMQPNQSIPEADRERLTYITSIGCGLSTFFLIVGLFIHFVMWRSKTRLGTTVLMHLFVALVLLNITFLSNQQITNLNNNVSCIIIAATMHFAMLATFTWFFIQALHFYLSLNATNTSKRIYKLSIIGLGWGLPAVVVIVIGASRNYGHIQSVQMCWLTNVYVHYIVNIGYYTLIFIFTSMIFIVIVRKITHTRLTKHGIIKTSSKKTGVILGLFVLLGLTWGVAFFSYGAMAIPSYYIFTILNSFQGFFLFLYYYFFRNDDVSDMEQCSDSSLKKSNDTSTTTSTVEVTET